MRDADTPTGTNKFWKPVPFPDIQEANEDLEWVWEGVLARRRITLFTAQAKAGKTTLLSLLIREMGRGGNLLGCKVSKGGVIVVSEECRQDWTIRRDNLGLGAHAEAVCLPFMTKPSAGDWLDLLREGYADIKNREVALVVFDTLSHLWPVQEENNNSQQQEALMPLRYISEQGPAVLLMHHAGKSGTGSRGATEVKGFVDQIADLELTTPADPTCRERRLTVSGRLTSAPERLTISLNEPGDDYQVVKGNLRPIRSAVWSALAPLIPTDPPGLTGRELRMLWPDLTTLPSENTIVATLLRCADKAGVRRTSDKPARWWQPK